MLILLSSTIPELLQHLTQVLDLMSSLLLPIRGQMKLSYCYYTSFYSGSTYSIVRLNQLNCTSFD